MADTKFSALTTLDHTSVASNDKVVVVDVSVPLGKTITVAELLIGASTLSGGVAGVTDASSASTGSVGEVITSTVVNTTVSVSSGTPVNITSITLTAGDWDVFGCVEYKPASLATLVYGAAGASTTTGTLPTTAGSFGCIGAFAAAPGVDPAVPIPEIQVNVNTGTVVYLVAQAGFATSTMTAGGRIWARRRR